MKLILVPIIFLVLFSGCSPERDVFFRFEGVLAEIDALGPVESGCKLSVDGRRRTIVVWNYTPEGSIDTTEYFLDRFTLIDLYSENYGSVRPTWIYEYAPSEGDVPKFLVYEYFDGRLEPRLQQNPAGDPRILQSYPEIPPVLALAPGNLPKEGDGFMLLQGRHFFVDGEPLDTTRDFREDWGYSAALTGLDQVFGDTYFDITDMTPVRVDGWTVEYVLRSQFAGAETDEGLPEPGAYVSLPVLVRLEEAIIVSGEDEPTVQLVFTYKTELSDQVVQPVNSF